MGQIADDIINGVSCSWCGIYFTGYDGLPVVCQHCFNQSPDDARKAGLQVSSYPEIGDEVEPIQKVKSTRHPRIKRQNKMRLPKPWVESGGIRKP